MPLCDQIGNITNRGSQRPAWDVEKRPVKVEEDKLAAQRTGTTLNYIHLDYLGGTPMMVTKRHEPGDEVPHSSGIERQRQTGNPPPSGTVQGKARQDSNVPRHWNGDLL